MTIPGAFTMAKLAQDEYYHDFGALIATCKSAANDEILALKAAGADVVKIDEPYLQANPAEAEIGLAAIDGALADVPGPTVVHLCFGYAGEGQALRLFLPAAIGRLPRRLHLAGGGSAAPRPRYPERFAVEPLFGAPTSATRLSKHRRWWPSACAAPCDMSRPTDWSPRLIAA